jgi:hypothetical protein
MKIDIMRNLYPMITQIDEIIKIPNVAYIIGVDGADRNSKPKYGK